MNARKNNNWTQEETAEFFDIGLTTIKSWCRLLKETGSLKPRPRGPGQKPKIDEKGLKKISEWVSEKPDLTIAELCEKYSKSRKAVSTSAISRTLKKLGLTFKKKPYQQRKKKERTFEEEKLNF